MNWLVRTFGAAFVRKLGYIAAISAVSAFAVLFKVSA